MNSAWYGFFLIMITGGVAFAQPVQFVNAFPGLSFQEPVFLTHSNDGTDRIFVVQQNGRIRVFPNDSAATSASTFLNITNKLSWTGGEQGLLGLAFHPQYATNGYFYVNYTAPNPLRTVIARYSVSQTDPNKADSLSEFVILEIGQPYDNHNGGMILFGADGYLYVGTGDGGDGGDPHNYGQNRSVLLGKILRINVDTTTATTNYGIPNDNPFKDNTQGYKEEIWAWGFRNPWRFSEDRVTGRMWVGDVGQGSWEEIDLLKRAGNFGWRCYEGNSTFNTSGCGPASEYVFPVTVYPNTGSDCAVTGGYVYRGQRRPELVGHYIYGDYCSGKVWKFNYTDSTATGDTLLINTSFLISSFGVDQHGELYLCNHGGTIQKFARSTVDVHEPRRTLPTETRLEQNHPNPFNPTTAISFQLSAVSFASLKVYDLLGREVATLVNETKQPGSYEVTWDASGMASGVYMYRLVTREHTATKRLLYMK